MFDFRRYNGLVSAAVPKRSAEEMVADAERAALAQMLGERRPMFDPHRKLAEAVEKAQADEEIVVPEQAKVEPEPGASFTEDTPKVELPSLLSGMRVRCLDVHCAAFGKELTVDHVYSGGQFLATLDEDTVWTFGVGSWLKTAFPADAALLPPKPFMMVALAIDAGGSMAGPVSNVAHGMLKAYSPGVGFWRGNFDTGPAFSFPVGYWLKRAWPVGSTEEVRGG